MAVGKTTLFVAPLYIFHSFASRTNEFYDLRDSQLQEE